MKLKTLVMIGMILTSSGCATVSPVPADQVTDQTWYFDCCNPNLSSADQAVCDLASQYDDRTMIDHDNNKYVFTWQYCKIGEEPWRKVNENAREKIR